MGRLLGLEEADGLAVLLDGHAHLGEDGLPLVADGLGATELVLPGLSELWKKQNHCRWKYNFPMKPHVRLLVDE